MSENFESLNVSMGTANMVGVVLSTMTFGEHYLHSSYPRQTFNYLQVYT